VVDQIPNKLAPEVLKNTNTKIIHKILARDDKETVGDTMLMDDKQKEYLSALRTGFAIVFSEDMEKPVHVYIERNTDTNEPDVQDEFVKGLFESERENLGDTYKNLEILRIYNVFKLVAENVNRGIFDGKVHQDFVSEVNKLVNVLNCSKKDVCEALCKWRVRAEIRNRSEADLDKMIKLLLRVVDEKIDNYVGLNNEMIF
jgi:hypothetical protein